MSAPDAPAVGLGTRFLFGDGDEQSVFDVTGPAPGGWETKGKLGEREVHRTFDDPFIRAAAAYLREVEKMRDAQEGWFAALELGAVVHYHTGFGAYVRTEVVDEDGRRQLLPTALVGAWAGRDAVRWWRRNIEMRAAWRPHHTGCFEAGAIGAGTPPAFDPRAAEPFTADLAPARAA